MWLPLQIRITNLGSIKSMHYRFNKGEARLIQGINNSDDGQQSNGSGKSLPLDAIAICLIGEPLRRNIRLVELIRDNCDFSELEFDLYNSITNKFFRIFTKISTKKSQVINLYISDTEENLSEGELKISSVEEKKKRILEEIGITKEDLLNYYLVYKDTYSSFFTSGDIKKKEIINRFSGGNLINGIEKEVEKEIESFDKNIKEKENQIQFILGKKSIIEESILELTTLNEEELRNKEIDSQKILILRSEEKIKDTKNNINKYIEEITKKQKLLYSLSNQILKINESINSFEAKDFSKDLLLLDNDKKELILFKKELESSKIKIEFELSEAKNYLKELELELKGTVSCPKCKHEFSATNNLLNISVVKNQVKESNLIINELKTSITKEEVKIVKIDKEVNLVEEEKEKINKTISEHNKLKIELFNSLSKLNIEQNSINEDIEKLNQKISSCELSIQNGLNYISELKKTISEIENRENIDKSAEINLKKIQVEEFESSVITLNLEIDLLKENKFKTNAWVFNFKKFRSYLSNQSIKTIENYINLTLTNIKSNLKIELEGFKMLADGKSIREEIDINILRNGLHEGAFGRYSSGERVRLVLASIVALQNIINTNCKTGGLGYLGLDEILESCDSDGIQALIQEFGKLNLNIDCITHGYHNVINIPTITMIKENGQTQLR